MSQTLITIIGIAAATATSLRVIPQVIKGFKTKKVRDVSVWWEFFGEISALLWFTYAVLTKDIPLGIATSIAFVCFLLLLYQKKIYSTPT